MLFLKLVLEMHEHSHFVLIIFVGEGGNAYLCRVKC